MLIETLITIVIISISMLGIIAMYTESIRNNTEARYRADASFIANEIIAGMRVDDRRPSVLKSNYEGGIGGTDGPKYTQWVANMIDNGRLPGVAENPPMITVTELDGFSPPDTSKSLVTIILRWQVPNSPTVHSYVVTTGIR